MKKENLIAPIIAIVIIVIVFLIVLFSNSEKKDIEVEVLDITYVNNQYFVNISLKNNQVNKGWISGTYLETIQGGVIDLTGAGIDEKVNLGKTIYLKLFSTEISESIADPPFILVYTVYPSGNSYSVEI